MRPDASRILLAVLLALCAVLAGIAGVQSLRLSWTTADLEKTTAQRDEALAYITDMNEARDALNDIPDDPDAQLEWLRSIHATGQSGSAP